MHEPGLEVYVQAISALFWNIQVSKQYRWGLDQRIRCIDLQTPDAV